MKRPTAPSAKHRSKKIMIGKRAFAAITAVEGLALGKESRERLDSLQSDTTLTPKQRRDAVLRAYAPHVSKK